MIDLARGYVGLFDPFRLRLARELEGLRKSELAKRVELTPAALSMYENGTSKPSATTLVKLAIALRQSIEFFATDNRRRASPDHGRAFFRSLRSARQLQRDRAEARAFLVSEVVDELRRHVRLPALNIPEDLHVTETADQEVVERQAEQLRQFWNLTPGPAPNMVRLLESNGIVVTRCSIDCREVDAFSRWFGEWPLVVLDSGKVALDRLRFDAAHELGHIVMHADPEPGNGVLEEQANWFAAAFLMPREAIRYQLPSRFVLQEFRMLKKIWGVSVAALLRRARDLKRMTDATYRRAMMMLSKMNQRKNESAFPLEGVESAVLLRKAVEVLEKAGYSIEDLTRDTRLTEAFVRETVFDDEDVRPRVEVSLT